jgi:hypothetical protein
VTSLLLSVAGVATCWCSSTGSYVISRASEIFSSLRRAGHYTQPSANVYPSCLRFSVRCWRVASGSFHPWCGHPPRKPCRPRRQAWRRMSPPEGSSRSEPLGVARRRVSALTGAPLGRRRACDLRWPDPLAWADRAVSPASSLRQPPRRQLAPGPLTPMAPRPCTLVQSIGRGLDLGGPFLSATPQPEAASPSPASRG